MNPNSVHSPTHAGIRRIDTLLCTALCLCFSVVNVSSAGDLSPPPGPIAPTHKTLTQVEPRTPISAATTPGDADSTFKITASGSYYLTSNITGQAAKHGIEIAANDVTIDLMGFSMNGVVGSLDGVSSTGVIRTGLAVRNGVVRGFGGDGIDLALSDNVRLAGIAARSNLGVGIKVENHATVVDCIATSNSGHGFESFDSCLFRDCVASLNGDDGFNATGTGSGVLSGCIAEGNGGIGLHGFGAYSFENCLARNNLSTGIFAGQQGASVSNCRAEGNSASGIFLVGGTVSGCSSVNNGSIGIEVFIGVVSGCLASSNGNHGIRVESGSLVIGNSCRNNGTDVTTGAGIRASVSDGNRIEGNNCVGADRGIDVASAGNVIVGNTCANNTLNFVIVANNIYGPIIDRTAPASAAVNGSAAAGTMGSTDPNANFSY